MLVLGGKTSQQGLGLVRRNTRCMVHEISSKIDITKFGSVWPEKLKDIALPCSSRLTHTCLFQKPGSSARSKSECELWSAYRQRPSSVALKDVEHTKFVLKVAREKRRRPSKH